MNENNSISELLRMQKNESMNNSGIPDEINE